MNRRDFLKTTLMTTGALMLAPALPAAVPAGKTAARRVRLGIDVVAAENFARLRGERVGLVTNQAGVDGNGESTTWLHFIPDSQETSDGYFSDVGSLFSGLSPTQSLALRAAVADACKNAGADFLLLPRYDMTTTSCWFFYESATCRVSGYPAKIQKIRQVRAGDVFRSEENAENAGDDAPESSR